ncbi:MAG: protease SohB [Moraxellaceae bacterium]
MLFHPTKQPSELRIRHLNARLDAQQQAMSAAIYDRFELLQSLNRLRKAAKLRKKNGERVFLLDFKGDVQASAVDTLREEITLILSMARAGKDQVVVRLESPGGLVHGYGLAAAQLARLREAGFKLTICVDKVAASGGYMMACLADKIVAAPFAVVGSIGVVAQLPNFNKLLKQHNIDFDVYTAGEYKRTVTVFGENSEEGKEKFESELQQTHALFKHFVEKYRPQLDVSKVATGEHWYGEDAISLKLVDQLQTSDGYIMSLLPTHDVYLIESRHKPTLAEKLGLAAAQMSASVVPAVIQAAQQSVMKFKHEQVQLRDPNY